MLGIYCLPFIAAWIMRNPKSKKDKGGQVDTENKFKERDEEIEDDYNRLKNNYDD